MNDCGSASITYAIVLSNDTVLSSAGWYWFIAAPRVSCEMMDRACSLLAIVVKLLRSRRLRESRWLLKEPSALKELTADGSPVELRNYQLNGYTKWLYYLAHLIGWLWLTRISSTLQSICAGCGSARGSTGGLSGREAADKEVFPLTFEPLVKVTGACLTLGSETSEVGWTELHGGFMKPKSDSCSYI